MTEIPQQGLAGTENSPARKLFYGSKGFLCPELLAQKLHNHLLPLFLVASVPIGLFFGMIFTPHPSSAFVGEEPRDELLEKNHKVFLPTISKRMETSIACAQVFVWAYPDGHPEKILEFTSTCDVPQGWIVVIQR